MEGKIIHFERKELLDRLSIMIPNSWKQMPKEYARIKYPSEFRPQIIITTADLNINMGFTIFTDSIICDDLTKMTERIQSAIHRANPDCRIYPSERLKDREGCWFAFRSHAMDSDIYNMMLITLVGRRIMQGSFNCPYKDYLKWKQIVLMMWNSILELKMGV